jgi:short-subunit dehydrogenase
MHALFEQTTDFTTYERLLRINTLSCVHLTRHALPLLKARRGLLVGVSSLAGKTGVPGRTAYCMSKFAMGGFFEALRIELDGSGVDVTMVLTNETIHNQSRSRRHPYRLSLVSPRSRGGRSAAAAYGKGLFPRATHRCVPTSRHLLSARTVQATW